MRMTILFAHMRSSYNEVTLLGLNDFHGRAPRELHRVDIRASNDLLGT